MTGDWPPGRVSELACCFTITKCQIINAAIPIATNIKSVDLTLFDILLFENPSPLIVLSLKIFLDLVSFRMGRGVYRYVKLPGRRQADLPKSVDREIIPIDRKQHKRESRSDMDKYYHDISAGVIKQNDQVTALALDRFAKRLAEEPVIRFYIDESNGYGNQANSIRILRILAAPREGDAKGFAYSNIIEIYYKEHNIIPKFLNARLTLSQIRKMAPKLSSLESVGDTLLKIKTLLPEWSSGRLNNATIKLVEYCDDPPDCQVTFGFTGGADDQQNSSQSLDLTKILNVKYALRLQPYLWNALGHQLQRKNQEPIALHDERTLGKDRFAQLAIRQTLPELPQETWENYFNSDNADLRDRAQILKWLTEAATGGNIDYCFVYGVRYPNFSELKMDYAEDALITLIASILHWQWDDSRQISSHAKPTIIVNLDTVAFDDKVNPSLLESILGGGYTREEIDHQQRGTFNERIEEAKVNRADYLAYLEARRRTKLQAGGTLPQIAQTYEEWLSGERDRVLLLQLGPVPPLLFDYAYSKATLPRIFEGQATANLALNVGKWYFHVARPGIYRKIRYPVANLGLHDRDPRLQSLQNVANQMRRSLTYSTAGEGWEITQQHNSDINGPSIIRNFMQKYIQEGSSHAAYFEEIRAFYADHKNCMLRKGLAFLESQLDDIPVYDSPAQSNHTLHEIYQYLQGEIEVTGKIAITSGRFNRPGAIGDLYTTLQGILRSHLIIENAVLHDNLDDELMKVTLTGTVAVAVMPNGVSEASDACLEFTRENDRVQLSFTLTQRDTFNLEESPRISILNPYLRLFVTSDLMSVTGEMGGTLSGLDLPVSFTIPARNGLWVFKSDFFKEIDISSVSAILAGIDLQKLLPESFASLHSLKLDLLEMPYNSNTKRLEYIKIDSSTNEDLSILPGLSLTNIKSFFTIVSSTSLKPGSVDIIISGDLQLGSGIIHIFGTPPSLTHHRSRPISGKITIEDMLRIFLPGMPLDFPSTPIISNISVLYDTDDRTYNVSFNLNTNWPISANLKINSLALALSNVPTVHGIITGTTTILTGPYGISLWMTGIYSGFDRKWLFESGPANGTVNLAALVTEYLGWIIDQHYEISDINLSFQTGNNWWQITGQLIENWDISFALDGKVSASGSIMIGNNETPFGIIYADVEWLGIHLRVFYDLAPDYHAFGITWNGISGKVEDELVDGDLHKIAKLQMTETIALDDLIARMALFPSSMVSGFGAPWTALNGVSTNNAVITFDFTAKAVTFLADVAAIDLQFARVDSVSLKYEDGIAIDKKELVVTLTGLFPWQADDSNTVSWDICNPGQTPTAFVRT